MHKFAWTKIVRHQIVKGAASADDPALAEYWAWRRRKAPLPINNTSLRLLAARDGRCPICRDTLLAIDDRPQTPREWERRLATTRTTTTIVAVREDGKSGSTEPRLLHTHCRTRHRAENGKRPALQDAHEPSGLACAGCAETCTSGCMSKPRLC